MRNKTIRGLMVLALLACLTGCAHQDAAMAGAVIGHALGTPLGAAAVAIEETFNTAEDISEANPRNAQPQRVQRRLASAESCARAPHRAAEIQGSRGGSVDNSTHYYRAEVIVKTRGPAQIQSIETGEAEEVTRFWR